MKEKSINNKKQCNKCRNVYYGDLSLNFSKNKNTSDKLQSYCKSCINEMNRHNRYKRKERRLRTKPCSEQSRKVAFLENDIRRLLQKDKTINKIEVVRYNITTSSGKERFFIEVLAYNPSNHLPFVLRKGDDRAHIKSKCDEILDEYLTACYNIYKYCKHIEIIYSEFNGEEFRNQSNARC